MVLDALWVLTRTSAKATRAAAAERTLVAVDATSLAPAKKLLLRLR
jgi:hypothetical protein